MASGCSGWAITSSIQLRMESRSVTLAAPSVLQRNGVQHDGTGSFDADQFDSVRGNVVTSGQ